MLICWSRKMLPWMSRLKILVFKWQYVSLWNLLLTVNPLLRNPFSWGNYGTKPFVSLIEEKAMTLLVIYHDVAKCNSGKVKHKTSTGQQSPSLILYGPVLVFNLGSSNFSALSPRSTILLKLFSMSLLQFQSIHVICYHFICHYLDFLGTFWVM